MDRSARLFGALVTSFVMIPAVASATAWNSRISLGEGWAVATNASGDVFALGTLRDANGDHIEVVKLSGADGSRLWTTVLGEGSAYGSDAITLTANGDVLVDGNLGEGAPFSEPAIVARLSGATGAELWRRTLPDGGVGAKIEDGDGNVFAAHTASSGGTGLGVVKLNGATGAILWSRDLSLIGTGASWHLLLEPDGDVVSLGSMRDNLADDVDIVIARVDGATGSELWRSRLDSTGWWDQPTALRKDGSGSIVAGFTSGQAEQPYTQRFVITKHDPADGSEDARYSIEPEPEYDPVIRELLLAADGGLVAIGEAFKWTPYLSRALVVKLDGSNGSELWRTVRSGPGGQYPRAQLSAGSIAGDGNIFASGFATGEDSYGDTAFYKLDLASGNVLWERTLVGARAWKSGDGARDIATAVNGDLVFAARMNSIRQPDVPGSELHSAENDFVVGRIDGDDGTAAYAADGLSLLVKNHGLHMSSNDRLTLTPPTADTPAEPTVSGGTLTILNPTTLESATYDLPTDFWGKKNAREEQSHAYFYRDKDGAAGPCRKLKLQPGRLGIKCKGTGFDFTLDEPSQGSLAVILSIGEPPTRYCTLFQSPAVGEDKPGVFRSIASPASTACPGWD